MWVGGAGEGLAGVLAGDGGALVVVAAVEALAVAAAVEEAVGVVAGGAVDAACVGVVGFEGCVVVVVLGVAVHGLGAPPAWGAVGVGAEHVVASLSVFPSESALVC